MTGNEYRTTIVCVDTYENDVPKGKIYNPFLTGGASFQSLMQFILQKFWRQMIRLLSVQ